jgi:hypothetical protein
MLVITTMAPSPNTTVERTNWAPSAAATVVVVWASVVVVSGAGAVVVVVVSGAGAVVVVAAADSVVLVVSALPPHAATRRAKRVNVALARMGEGYAESRVSAVPLNNMQILEPGVGWIGVDVASQLDGGHRRG